MTRESSTLTASVGYVVLKFDQRNPDAAGQFAAAMRGEIDPFRAMSAAKATGTRVWFRPFRND